MESVKLTRRSLFVGAALPLLGYQKPKLPLLVIDGVNNHDWQPATHAIRAILEATGRFTVDVSTTPPADAPPAAWDGWRPKFSGYAAVVNNFNGGEKPSGIRWPGEVERALTEYLSRGGGLVNFHAANNAFLEWADYNEMIGLGWRDKSFGPSLIIDDHERVVVIPAGEGLQPGHGPRHDFQMTTRDPRHPITLGFPKHWMHPSEQLTHGQHAPEHPKHGAIEKELRILTYAWSKDSKENEPMDWLRSWGRGRIYTTLLGHTWKGEPSPNLRCAGFQALFSRAVEWAATGRVTLALPAKLPTADTIVLNEALEV